MSAYLPSTSSSFKTIASPKVQSTLMTLFASSFPPTPISSSSSCPYTPYTSSYNALSWCNSYPCSFEVTSKSAHPVVSPRGQDRISILSCWIAFFSGGLYCRVRRDSACIGAICRLHLPLRPSCLSKAEVQTLSTPFTPSSNTSKDIYYGANHLF